MDKLTGETDWRKEKTDIYIRLSTPNLSLCGGNRQLLSPLLQRKNYCVEKDFSLMEKRRGEDRYLLLVTDLPVDIDRRTLAATMSP